MRYKTGDIISPNPEELLNPNHKKIPEFIEKCMDYMLLSIVGGLWTYALFWTLPYDKAEIKLREIYEMRERQKAKIAEMRYEKKQNRLEKLHLTLN